MNNEGARRAHEAARRANGRAFLRYHSQLTGATHHPLLRGAQMTEAPMLSFPLSGATRHPSLRGAQMTEQISNL
ncbi:hypothetical protein A2U01_0076284, partial [Trifolium medium]|nr:hypothetical protein [Trifolium medium]